jgi:prepilin-type N-terminal cleavage/methylation domain-containing protein
LRRGSRSKQHGFTLIEIMAVVLIIGMTFGLVLPNLSSRQGDRLKQEAFDVISRIELARERSVLTGAHHRLVVDLDRGAYHIEWFVTEDRAYGRRPQESEEVEPPDYTSARTPLLLTPPEHEARDNYPTPGDSGKVKRLGPGFFFVGLEAPGGWIEEGLIYIVFEQDGTTDYAELVVGDDYDNELILEIRPLLDQVRVRERDDDA